MQIDTYRSGFVAIIGRPNVGKSTFLNKIIGKKIAIMSDKPQTTRNKILGIKTTDTYQIAFTDTSGIHKPTTELQKRMVNASYDATSGVDAIIFMTTPVKEVLPGDGYKVALLDLGAKGNIEKVLNSLGCQVTIYPAFTSAEEILSEKPDGIMISNGPGDPKELTTVIKEVKK